MDSCRVCGGMTSRAIECKLWSRPLSKCRDGCERALKKKQNGCRNSWGASSALVGRTEFSAHDGKVCVRTNHCGMRPTSSRKEEELWQRPPTRAEAGNQQSHRAR